MTKHYIYFSLLLLAGFGSCDPEASTDSPRMASPEIRFNASTYQLETQPEQKTKAIQTGETFPAGTSIGIFGWGHAVNESSPMVARADLINNKYTTDNGTDFISSSPAHFPIAEDTVIDLYAYSPYLADASSAAITYTLADQQDIMYATPVLNKGKLDIDTDSEKTYASIPLAFNHALSAITLVMKKADDITETLQLEKVELLNYPSKATWNLRTQELTPGETVGKYLVSNASKTITPAETVIVKDYLVWPGKASTFRFTISGHEYEVTPQQAFLANRQQQYTFTIQAKDISVSAAINPWEQGPSSSGDIGF